MAGCESLSLRISDGDDSWPGKAIAIKKYIVRLSSEEREQLSDFIRSGKRSAQLLTKARILLKADVSETGEAGVTARSPRLWTPVSPTSSGRDGNWWRKGSKRR